MSARPVVTCYECRPVDRSPGPREWDYGCTDCAELFRDYHRSDTGHEKVEVRMVEVIGTKQLLAMLRRVG